MNIRVVKYALTDRIQIQGFVDVLLDGWLRINGLHLLRNGSLQPAHLTPLVNGKRRYIDAVEVVDGDRGQQIVAEILEAIHAYVESLPPERRSRPPVEWKPKPKPKPDATVAPAKPKTILAQSGPIFTKKAKAPPPHAKPLPPPARLRAGLEGRR